MEAHPISTAMEEVGAVINLWRAADGHRWRCAPCDWEGEYAEFRLDDCWAPDGPPASFAFCPRCGRALDVPSE